MNTPTDPSTASDSPIDPRQIETWASRLRGSATSAVIFAAPVFFVVLVTIALIANWQPDKTVSGHIVSSIGLAIVGTLTLAPCLWYAIFQMSNTVESAAIKLIEKGTIVPATFDGKVGVCGGSFMTYVIGGALGAIWQPIAPILGENIPVFQVNFEVEIDGKTHYVSELLFANEVDAVALGAELRVVVDPKSPVTKHWLVRPLIADKAIEAELQAAA